MTRERHVARERVPRTAAIVWAVAVLAQSAFDADYYVAPSGTDAGPGSEPRPFRSVQKALDTVRAGDTVHIKAGTYDLAGYSKIFSEPLMVLGEDKATTILKNAGSLTIDNSLTLGRLTFQDAKGTRFPVPAERRRPD